MGTSNLPIRNLLRRPGRTAALVLLTALLAASVFGGSVVVSSLRSGLDSLEARLGADIIVMPAEAESKVSFKNILLQGTTGAFYMAPSVLDEVCEAQGVERAAPQTFLASLKADCCAVKVQIIGIDPGADFTVKPWIEERYSRELGDMEVAVGCDVAAGVGETLKIYDQRTHVVAKLAETGTGLDTAVYCNMDTMKKLLAAAEAKGVTHRIDSGSDVISAVYVKVRDGYDVGEVNNWLNGHIRKVTAVRARSMFTDVSESLSGISRAAWTLIGAVWALALAVLLGNPRGDRAVRPRGGRRRRGDRGVGRVSVHDADRDAARTAVPDARRRHAARAGRRHDTGDAAGRAAGGDLGGGAVEPHRSGHDAERGGVSRAEG